MSELLKPTELRCIKFTKFIMKLLGLYYHQEEHWLYKTYFFIVMFITWLNFVKSFSVFKFFSGGIDSLSQETFANINNSLWLLGSALNTLLMFALHHKKWRIENFLHNFNLLFKYFENPNQLIRKLNLIIYISVAFTIAALLAYYLTCVIPMYTTNSTAIESFLAPFQNTDWSRNSPPYLILISIMLLFSTTAYYMPVAYFFIHCVMVNLMLNEFNNKFQNFVINAADKEDENEKEEIDFDFYFKWHQKNCSLIEILNECYNKFIAVNIYVNIPQVFLTLYVLANAPQFCIVMVVDFMGWIYYLLILSIILIIIAESAAKLNTNVSF